MTKVVGLLRLVSLVAFLAVLALVYVYLGARVQLSTTSGEMVMDRGAFFYAACTTVVVLHLIFLGLNRLIRTSALGVQEGISNWLGLLFPVLVFYFICLIGFIGIINNPAHANPSNFVFLTYLGPVLIVVWLLSFFYVKRTE